MITPEFSLQPERKVGILLFIGIFLWPIIFAWFLIRKGHTLLARGLGFGWLIFTCLVLFVKAFSPSSLQPTTSERLVQASTEHNKNLPKMIDSSTRLDSISAGPGNQLVYYYTIVNKQLKVIMHMQAKSGEFAEYVTALQCKTHAENAMQYSDAITNVFVYRDNDGKEIARVPINESICMSFSSTKKTANQAELIRAVEIEQKSLPTVLADGIRFDTINITGPNEVTMRFTLPIRAEEVDVAAIKSRENVLLACSKLKSALSRGITYIYDYSGSDGIHVDSLRFDEKTCQGAP